MASSLVNNRAHLTYILYVVCLIQVVYYLIEYGIMIGPQQVTDTILSYRLVDDVV